MLDNIMDMYLYILTNVIIIITIWDYLYFFSNLVIESIINRWINALLLACWRTFL